MYNWQGPAIWIYNDAKFKKDFPLLGKSGMITSYYLTDILSCAMAHGGVAAILAQSDNEPPKKPLDPTDPPILVGKNYSYVLCNDHSTKLNAHINGNFVLSIDRKVILQQNNTHEGWNQYFLQQNNTYEKWNRYILLEVLPSLHVKLLDKIAKINYKQYEHFKNSYKIQPNNIVSCITKTTKGVWPFGKVKKDHLYYDYALNVLKNMGESKVFWTEANEGKFVSLEDAYFSEENNHTIANILAKHGIPTVKVEKAILHQLKNLSEKSTINKEKDQDLFPKSGPSRFICDLDDELSKIFKKQEISWNPSSQDIPNRQWLDDILEKMEWGIGLEFAKLLEYPLHPVVSPSNKLVRVNLLNPLLTYSVNPDKILRKQTSQKISMETLFSNAALSEDELNKLRKFVKDSDFFQQGNIEIIQELPIWPTRSEEFISAKEGKLLPRNLPSYSLDKDLFAVPDEYFRILTLLGAKQFKEFDYVKQYYYTPDSRRAPTQEDQDLNNNTYIECAREIEFKINIGKYNDEEIRPIAKNLAEYFCDHKNIRLNFKEDELNQLYKIKFVPSNKNLPNSYGETVGQAGRTSGYESFDVKHTEQSPNIEMVINHWNYLFERKIFQPSDWEIRTIYKIMEEIYQFVSTFGIQDDIGSDLFKVNLRLEPFKNLLIAAGAKNTNLDIKIPKIPIDHSQQKDKLIEHLIEQLKEECANRYVLSLLLRWLYGMPYSEAAEEIFERSSLDKMII
ncbi:putative Sacsin [Gigaspora margarita]|uniref:Putative Sacsin n=1 Tax=Gigaspora margarita TaxID=4874 RepID=A0A8H3X6F2_GIGMA|nr:putative Sacsin [Gigaspora margarita]